jgi:SAM-dependent methyltransferase
MQAAGTQQAGRATHDGQQPAELRARLHGMWSAVAGSWGEHADAVDARTAHVAARMLELAAPRPGERVLELACGPGGVGLAAARLVAPDGEVVLSDAVAEMTSIAAARAAALGLAHVTTRELDLERIDEPDASFDVVLCREGLMLTADPGRAAREIRRILRPDGRVAISVWGPRERNPWLGLVFDAVAAEVGRPVPPPGIPGPFSLEDAGRLAGLLHDAGIAGVVVEELPAPAQAASFDEWWERTSALAGPLSTILASLPAQTLGAITARLRTLTASYETAAGVELPGVVLVANGRV